MIKSNNKITFITIGLDEDGNILKIKKTYNNRKGKKNYDQVDPETDIFIKSEFFPQSFINNSCCYIKD